MNKFSFLFVNMYKKILKTKCIYISVRFCFFELQNNLFGIANFLHSIIPFKLSVIIGVRLNLEQKYRINQLRNVFR